jgi:ectoine hydroxylase-related dioxygenase (phytanoyl-CoA dioxygenase family)
MFMTKLTPQQINFFETFGYLVLPGLMADSIDWITAEFEAVFTDRGIVHDGTKRSCVVPFIDQRLRLATLLDDPRIEGVAASLLGDDFNYLGGDGNYYTGDTPWHSDDFHEVGQFLKIAFYLDPVSRETGALRVIPGSHRIDLRGKWTVGEARQSRELWGIEMNEVPAIALESEPGDVVVFNHNLMHAAFGGSSVRRMFTLNICQRAKTTAEIEELKRYISGCARFWIESTYSDLMKETASPQRTVHLEQVLANESHLPELAAKARLEMAEPSRN